MIDGSECGIVSHLQLIFGSLHYRETSGKFRNLSQSSVFQVFGRQEEKMPLQDLFGKWYCNARLFMKRLPIVILWLREFFW
ncbi:hypothetical protein CEXT_777541 [Caerostris extrusa]|uniref:Uncharacterized protein n=1 Tax=Caerostris extrusa TaxID=172846 RepID=A0AAV4R7J6_CAEEX|nr:hypothetical protein CEXT_777541 [Caerostris extrusa]